MKKYWIRILSFILLFCLIFTFFNQALILRWNSWTDFYKLPKNSVDVLFMGNSHSIFTFKPSIVNDILPVNSYMVGIPAENVILTYYELKEVLKYQHPKVVIFETFAADFDLDIKLGHIFRLLDNMRWGPEKVAVISRYIAPRNLDSLFPILRTRLDWAKPEEFISQVTAFVKGIGSKEIDPLRGASTYTEVISNADYQDQSGYYNIHKLTPDSDNLVYLQKMVDLCKENNIQIIFTTTPFLQADPAHYDYSDPLGVMDFAKENDIPTILFDPGKLTQIHYHDIAHVDDLGSLVLTTDLSEQLSGLMKVPVNEAALKNYRDLEITNYTVSVNGNSYTITLNQADPEVPLQYYWRLLEDNVVVDRTDWQNSNSYTFTADGTNNVKVSVQIKNPAMNYFVRLSFQMIDKE